MPPLNVLFVAPSQVSSGEAITALHMANWLLAEGCDVRFLASPFAAGFVSSGLGDRVTVMSSDRRRNQLDWDRLLAGFQPDCIVFADYPLLAFGPAASPLWDADWESGLSRIDAGLFTLDHLGYAQHPGLVFFGPPRDTIGVQSIPAIPERMRILLPCPLHHPDRTRLRGRAFRYCNLDPLKNRAGAGAGRDRYLRSPDEMLVLHVASQWACQAAALLRHPHYPLLPRWLCSHLEGLGRPVTVLSVNDGSLLPEVSTGSVRVLNAKPVTPAQYESLLAAADLVITENRISVTLGKAICLLRPCAVLHNSRSILEIIEQGEGSAAALAQAMEGARPGSVFPFEVFPIWSGADLESLGIFDEGCLEGAYSAVELFGGGSAARQLRDLLTGEAARARMELAQRSYLRRLEALPTPLQALSGASIPEACGEDTPLASAVPV